MQVEMWDSVASQGLLSQKAKGWGVGNEQLWWRVVFCSPWGIQPFLHLHILPTHFLPSPTAPTLILGTHKWVGYRLMGLTFDGG